MRPKVVAAIFLLAAGILGITVFILGPFHREPAGKIPETPPVTQNSTGVFPGKKPAENTVPPTLPPPADIKQKTEIAPPVPVIPKLNQTSHDPDFVHERVNALMALAMNNDSNSFNAIWHELSNTDREIRAGALEAVVQFGDRSAVPRLRELATRTEDPAEKTSILAAADYLELPTLSEVSATRPLSGSSSLPAKPPVKYGFPRRKPSPAPQGN
ncbi:MAG: HEAT repeat domain-containing protein [Verrucomicrobiota bacterium]